jgi:squalene-hopene/tetraprenyl-beta-curcumene cyclase
LRSSAGMTYAGLKSMIHAGLTQDDPRVKAALEYIRKHYTVDAGPTHQPGASGGCRKE